MDPAEAADSFVQLLAQARRHDPDALAALYRHAFPTIYRYVLARSQRPDLAEDIVADVFLTMVEAIGTLRATQEVGFFAWLLRIAQFKVAHALRQAIQQRTHLHALPAEEDVPALQASDLASDPQALQEWRDLMQELGVALGALSATQQMVIIGRFLEGQSIEELAHALGKPPGTIRVVQFRALGTLAERLGVHRRSGHREAGGPG